MQVQSWVASVRTVGKDPELPPPTGQFREDTDPSVVGASALEPQLGGDSCA